MKYLFTFLLRCLVPVMSLVDLGAIVAKMEACFTDMNDLLGKSKSEKDEEKRKGYVAAYGAKSEQFKGLQAELDEGKALNAAEEEVSKAKKALEPDMKGKTIAPPKQPGSPTEPKIEFPTDEAKEEHDKVEAFKVFAINGKSAMTNEQRNMLEPGERFNRVDALSAGDGVVLPKSIARKVAFGKAMLSTDADSAANSNASKLLAPDWRPQLIVTPFYQPMLFDRCQVIPAYNGKATWPILLDSGAGGSNFGGVAFTWKATEGADKGETGAKFGDFEILTHELSGWTEMSNTMLRRSAIPLESFITELFRNACRFQWSKTILSGAGDNSNQPNGLINYTGIKKVQREAAGQVSWNDLTALEYAITKAHRAGARYLCDDTVEKYLKQSVDTLGRPLFTPDMASGPRTNMAGYAYDTHEFTPAVGDDGDVVFGNFMNYWWAVEEDIAIARSDHAEFKKGRVVFRLICFVGGKPVRGSAFSQLSNAAEAGVPEA